MSARLSSEVYADRTRATVAVAPAPVRLGVHNAPDAIVVMPRPTPVQPKITPRTASMRKRWFDVVVASAALGALAPLLALTWIAIRLTSRGPGLHWSERVGRNERVFLMPKFRTMAYDAPQAPRELLADAVTHVTPIGAVLRRWCLDELPQLISIIRGDMSFIGPRPLMASDPAQFARAQFPDAHAARPGLSGLSQIRGRNHVTPRRKARLDAFYARSRSGWFDLEIFARTVAVLLSGRGFI